MNGGLAFDSGNAARCCQLAADHKIDEAQFNYLNCLHDGRGVPVDLINAVEYHKLAADHNIAEAQFNYANCLELGLGVRVDLTNAVKYYKLAADQNFAPAQLNYANCLHTGRGVRVDLINAVKYYKLAADQNFAEAQFGSANGLPTGPFVDIDVAHAVPLEWRLASPPNAESAIAQYEWAADSGAMCHLGECLEFGEGILRNPNRAAACYQLSMSHGDIESYVAFGFCTEHGIGVNPNVSEALVYYQTAALQGSSAGAVHCAWHHQHGIGRDEDLDDAASYYQLISDSSFVVQHSFRCLRSLKKASAPRARLSRLSKSEEPPCHDFTSVRSPTVSQDVRSYETSPVGSGRGPVIGTGGFSTITSVKDRVTGNTVAVKHISLDLHERVFTREVDSLVKLNHPCVVRISHWATSRDRKEGQIHMEFATNGSLAELFEKRRSGVIPTFWNPTGIGIIVCGLVLGMRYVHSRQILHLDLKPGNIFLNGNGHPLIGDFGSSRSVYDNSRSEETTTIYYAAPEMWEGDSKRTIKCDVFSFGLVLYEILAGKPVFDPSERPHPVLKRLRAGDLPEIPAAAGPVMAGLIPKCWAMNPEQRPSFAEVFKIFESCQFEIMPGADRIELSNFCTTVLRWEARAGIRI
jgi:TPR repeat protein